MIFSRKKKTSGFFKALRKIIEKEKKLVKEIDSSLRYYEQSDSNEKPMILSHIKLLKQSLKKINSQLPEELSKINLVKPLTPEKKEETKKKISQIKLPVKPLDSSKKLPDIPSKPSTSGTIGEKIESDFIRRNFEIRPEKNILKRIGFKRLYSKKDLEPDFLEKETIKRMKIKRKKKIIDKKEQKPNPYVVFANSMFSDLSKKIVKKKSFEKMEEDLIKANLKFTPHSYLSVIFLSTVISVIVALFVAVFFLFFSIGATMPIVTLTSDPFNVRILKVFWLLFVVPIATFVIMLIYPSLEKGAAQVKIDEEIPFATIHMSAISGSLIDPSKIFNIIIMTNEYPYLEKEFTKLINEINIYGYDLVSALKDAADKSPSKKLSELFNGLATTINSGGDLPGFFDKRSQTLLFEHSIEKEKKTKAAETFMDIYISVVIAAPMILMILLMMMKISGLGLSLSMSMITIIMVIAVTGVNIVFLTFLHLKK